MENERQLFDEVEIITEKVYAAEVALMKKVVEILNRSQEQTVLRVALILDKWEKAPIEELLNEIILLN